MSRMVWVELNDAGQPIRIFRSERALILAMPYNEDGPAKKMEYMNAVGAIRRAIFSRSKGLCELCAAPIIESTAHMHERTHRGKGGEISLVNSVMICVKCHNRAHSDRSPRWSV